MKKQIYITYTLLGVVAAILFIIGDWLVGYIDPTLIGESGMLRAGYNDIELWKPVLSMVGHVLN